MAQRDLENYELVGLAALALSVGLSQCHPTLHSTSVEKPETTVPSEGDPDGEVTGLLRGFRSLMVDEQEDSDDVPDTSDFVVTEQDAAEKPALEATMACIESSGEFSCIEQFGSAAECFYAQSSEGDHYPVQVSALNVYFQPYQLRVDVGPIELANFPIDTPNTPELADSLTRACRTSVDALREEYSREDFLSVLDPQYRDESNEVAQDLLGRVDYQEQKKEVWPEFSTLNSSIRSNLDALDLSWNPLEGQATRVELPEGGSATIGIFLAAEGYGSDRWNIMPVIKIKNEGDYRGVRFLDLDEALDYLVAGEDK